MSGSIPAHVIAAVGGAALLHATWNALVKARGNRDAPADPLPATVLVVLGGAIASALLLPVGGVSTVASYGIALWAMTLAPIAAIAALRETSILFATGIAALFCASASRAGACWRCRSSPVARSPCAWHEMRRSWKSVSLFVGAFAMAERRGPASARSQAVQTYADGSSLNGPYYYGASGGTALGNTVH